MNHRLRTISIAFVVCTAMLLGVINAAAALQVGEKAPLFELPATTGQTIKLADYLGKQPVVLFFYIGAFTKT